MALCPPPGIPPPSGLHALADGRLAVLHFPLESVPLLDRARGFSGCSSSAFWAVTGPTKYMSLMTKRACNVAFGAWYYYVNATGNGNASKTTYPFQYCGNVTPTPATLVTGLRSHLMGSDVGRGAITTMAGVNALQSSDGTSYEYVTQIKQRFDGALGAPSGTHPFFVVLQPEKPKYCR